jgi:hypothetical protein
VLEHGAGDHLTEPFTFEAEPGHQAVDRGGEHVLVGRIGIDRVGAGERDPVAADHGDATGAGVHAPILSAGRLGEKAMRARSRNVDSELHMELHGRA